MTDFDRKLIEKAKRFSRYDYRKINFLIELADTEEARDILDDIKNELYQHVLETV